jgi:glycosyltransferase involved in cell wall biosynthesis/2-polyprenyl-3-methyl-5-hydroxy-6-metoxy-1,4-benzoquinol methylase
MTTGPKLTVVHPFCTHYTSGLFEKLAQKTDTHFYFFSKGDDWFWEKRHGVSGGKFSYEYLPGLRIGRSRIPPALPLKLFRRKSDVIISSIDGKFALPVAYLAARLKGVPFLLWTGIWSSVETPFHRLIFPITRYLYRHADAVLAYGEHVKKYLIAQGVLPDRIFVARHSVDNEWYARTVSDAQKAAVRARIGVSSDQKIVLSLGRLEAVKGIRYLIEAFAEDMPADAKLVVAGEGSERSSLEEMARSRCGPGRVVFLGYVPVEAAVELYSIAEAFVIPSITTPAVKELWGLVVNEAFNQGVPVIATDAVGAAAGGLVQDGFNGFIVPERDAVGMRRALEHILCDEALRGKLSAGAKASVQQWNHEEMAETFMRAVNFALQDSIPTRSQFNVKADDTGQQTKADGHCPLCSSTARRFRRFGAFRKCVSCGLLFRHPMPTAQDLETLYSQSWQVPAENSNETGGTTPEYAEVYADRLIRSLGRRDLNGLRILEYGAGRGEFLEALSRRGAQVFALEPYGRNYLQQRGFKAYAAVEELPKDLRVDGIVTIDVVEHELAAWNVLRSLRPFLTANGWLYVATPNPQGLNARVFGARWREACKPGHLLFFPPETLEAVLQSAGFVRTRRLRWNMLYRTSLLSRAKDLVLSFLRLDGELRYLAFQSDECS